MKCNTCQNERYCYDGNHQLTRDGCADNEFAAYVPQTYADRIRAMTDEELAETFAGGCPNGDRLNCGKHYLHGGRDCFSCWLDWLKSPVEVDE